MPTIKDVAARANVSTATVSHVINNTRFVSPDLKARVLAAMQELNYRPDGLARSLRQGKTRTLGIIVSDILNPFYTSVVRGVEDTAVREGYNLILCNSDDVLEKEKQYVNLLLEKRVDGIILTPTCREDHSHLLRVVSEGLPLVFLDRRIAGLKVDTVLVDHYKGALKAVSFLIAQGYRRIATIAGVAGIFSGDERMRGYRDALRDAGLEVEESLVVRSDFKRDDAYLKTREFLARVSAPIGLFVQNNQMMLGVLRAVAEKGWRLKDEVGVVCFDDTEWAPFIQPPLTAVAQPTYELGREAARVLLRRLKHGSVTGRGRVILLEPELKVRSSA